MSAECCGWDSPQLKAHLVVALSGGAVRHRVRAHLPCDLNLALGDERPRDGGPQEIHPFVKGVCPAARDGQSAAAAPQQQCLATVSCPGTLLSAEIRALVDTLKALGVTAQARMIAVSDAGAVQRSLSHSSGPVSPFRAADHR